MPTVQRPPALLALVCWAPVQVRFWIVMTATPLAVKR
jgi:hypothetical protein